MDINKLKEIRDTLSKLIDDEEKTKSQVGKSFQERMAEIMLKKTAEALKGEYKPMKIQNEL